MVRATGMLLLAAVLIGCGHRGSLYLPGKPGDPAFDRQNHDSRTGAAPTVSVPAKASGNNDKPGSTGEPR